MTRATHESIAAVGAGTSILVFAGVAAGTAGNNAVAMFVAIAIVTSALALWGIYQIGQPAEEKAEAHKPPQRWKTIARWITVTTAATLLAIGILALSNMAPPTPVVERHANQPKKEKDCTPIYMAYPPMMITPC